MIERRNATQPAISLDIPYFFIDKPLSEIAVFVWKIVHIPPKVVKAVISAIIK